MAPNRSSDPLFSPHDRSTRDPRRFGSLGSGSRSSPEFVSPKIGLCSAGRRRKPAVDSPEIELPVGSPFIGSAHGSAGFAPSSDLPHQSVSLSLSRFCLSLSIGFNVSWTKQRKKKTGRRKEKKKNKERGRLGSHSVSLSDSPTLSPSLILTRILPRRRKE
jgi:hypothetical protein